MLRHDHVSLNLKPEAAPHALQVRLEDSSVCIRSKELACPERLSAAKESNGAMVATESDEMTLSAVLKTR